MTHLDARQLRRCDPRLVLRLLRDLRAAAAAGDAGAVDAWHRTLAETSAAWRMAPEEVEAAALRLAPAARAVRR